MKPSAHKEYRIDLSRVSTNELVVYKEYLELDPIKFQKEIEDIEQELQIRKLEYCKPLSDLINI